MAGLKLQYLTNPSGGDGPKFIFGNPVAEHSRAKNQKRSKKQKLARKSKARENQDIRSAKMARKRHKSSAKKRNPIAVHGQKGTHIKRVSVSLTRPERAAGVAATRKMKEFYKKRLESGMLTGKAAAEYKKALRKRQRGVARGKFGVVRAAKAVKAAEAQGYKTFASHMTPDELRAIKIGEGRAKAARSKKAAKSRAASKRAAAKRKAAAKKAAKKAAKTRRLKKKEQELMAKKSKRKARKSRKTRKHGRKKSHKKSGKKSHGRKKGRKSGGRKKARKHSRKSHRKHGGRKAHRKHGGRKKARKSSKKHSARKGRKMRVKRNPEGTSGKSMSAKIMEALNKITGGEASNAPYLAAASVGNDVVSAAFQGALMKYAPSVVTAMAKVSPNLPVYVLPVVPGLATAYAASKSSNQHVKKLGQAIGLITLIDLVQSLSSLVSGPVMRSVGLEGVDFTVGRKRGMRGVDYTRMGAVPRGLQAIPSLRGVDVTPMHGLTARDRADFGRERQVTSAGTITTPADFGRQMADFGAVPSLRGAHTMDRQYADAQPDESGDDSDNPEEGSDHTV